MGISPFRDYPVLVSLAVFLIMSGEGMADLKTIFTDVVPCTLQKIPGEPGYMSQCTLFDYNKNRVFQEFIKGNHIRYLDLMFLDLTEPSLPERCLSHVPNVYLLEITANCPFQVTGKTFEGLHKLREFSIHNIYPTTIMRDIRAVNDDKSNLTFITTMESHLGPAPILDPSWLQPISKLEHLNLNNLEISSFAKGEFCGLYYLKSLNLRNNQLNTSEGLGITQTRSGIFTGSSVPCLPNLTSLDISQNNISVLSVIFADDLPKLKYLDISRCSLTSLEPDAGIVFTEYIEELDLSNNKLSSLIAHDLNCTDSKLRLLHLQNNRISTVSPRVLSCLKNLQYLNLRKNLLSTGDVMIEGLRDLTELEKLDLSSNNITVLANSTFGNMKDLLEFSCELCGLRWIQKNSFSVSEKLKVLRLKSNSLDVIDSTFFTNLKSLKVLDLSNNFLEDFKMAGPMPQLTELHLDLNLLEQIPNISSVCFNLTLLKLNANFIYEIQPHYLSPCFYLVELDLSLNNISRIPDNAFSNLLNLQVINLACNMIWEPASLAFSAVWNLRDLRLDNNLLTAPPDLSVGLPNLLYLNLSYNYLEITTLSLPASIEWVDVSHNEIKRLECDSIRTTHLKFLNLSFNMLRTINPKSFQILTLPRPQVFLQGNPLHCDCSMDWLLDTKYDASIGDIYKKGGHRTGKYGFGNCSSYDSAPLRKTLNDSSLEFRTYLVKVADLDLAYCHTGMKDAMQTFSDLTKTDFLCPYTTECNSWDCHCCDEKNITKCPCRSICYDECGCFHRDDHSINVMNCSSRHITGFRTQSPFYAKVIFLDGNKLMELRADRLRFPFLKVLFLNASQISYIESGAFSNLGELTELHLEENNINEVTVEIFGTRTLLEKLYLQNNEISYIGNDSFDHMFFLKVLWLNGNKLQTLDLSFLKTLDLLSQIAFHDNPWRCDCIFGPELKRSLVDILKRSVTLLNARDIRCASNRSMDYDNSSANSTAEPVAENHQEYWFSQSVLEESFSFCTNPIIQRIIKYSKTESVIAIASTAAILILLGTVMVIIYRNRLLARVWFYNRYGVRFRDEDVDDANRPYDVFISYSEEDEEFVLYDMLPVLEYGESSYKVCLECRDMPPVGTAETILAAIQQSKRTIIIVSEHYFEYQWCQYTFQAGHYQVLSDRQLRLIIILTDESLRARMDREMSLYLKTNAYLVQGEKYFWKKLRYYLADKPRGADELVGRPFKMLDV